MKLICAVLILLLALMTSAQCQWSPYPPEAAYRYNEGVNLYNQGKYDEAYKVLDEAIRLYPGLTDDAEVQKNIILIWSHKGDILTDQGNYADAIVAYDKAIWREPNLATAWAGKGRALVGQGKFNESIKAYDMVIKFNPNDVIAWYNKGVALEALGKTTEANAAFAKAKELGYSG